MVSTVPDERDVLHSRIDTMLEEIHRLHEILEEVNTVCAEYAMEDNDCANDVLFVIKHWRVE